MSEGKSYKDLLKFYTPGILAFCAAIFGTAGNLYCETVQFVQQEENNDSQNDDPLIVYAGMWTFRTNDMTSTPSTDPMSSQQQVCRTYDSLVSTGFDYDMDATSRFVMAFAILTPIIGGLALCLACVGPCCNNLTPSRWRAMGGVFLLSGIFQGSTLAVMQSSVCKDNPVLQYFEEYNLELLKTFPTSGECKAYTGYYLSIVAVALWILAGAAALVLPAPHVDGRQPEQTQTVTYQRDGNGNVTESNVVIVKGTNPSAAIPEQAKPNVV
ncbi:MAG: hypothetical protein SGBAC_011156 [Bacillariaceae sp.]